MLRTLPRFRDHESAHEVLDVEEKWLPDTFPWHQVHAVSSRSEKPDAELLKGLLGHPPNADLLRILKHRPASDQAFRLAKEFSCGFCRGQQKPSVPLPAQSLRVSEFNHRIGLDVKKCRGWKPNQKVCALNIVDQASSFQRMVLFFEQEDVVAFQETFARALDLVDWCH